LLERCRGQDGPGRRNDQRAVESGRSYCPQSDKSRKSLGIWTTAVTLAGLIQVGLPTSGPDLSAFSYRRVQAESFGSDRMDFMVKASSARLHETGLSSAVAGKADVKMAESVARQLEDEIIARGWPVGEVLGSEAEFVERLGISRAVFREAIRLLEHHDVAKMRRGPGGGLVVTAPNTSGAVRAMALTLEYQGAGVRDIVEARAALELESVVLAAKRIDEQGILLLRQTLERESHPAGINLGGTHNLHTVIAQISGNPAFVVFLEVLTKLTTHSMSQTQRTTDAAAVRKAHERIVEAVIEGDPVVARHRMSAHLNAMEQWLDGPTR
jgi:DNA-binding FadR family transcriptional regulator